MRLHSIKVQNYRLHENVAVELDPARTLIGGPNESGKSTLVEAAHRALFLKAKLSGEAQKSMVSKSHQGHPEVEVHFDAGGKTYRIAKKFSGANGTATLSEEGGDSWHGDDAESRLADVLKVDQVGGGRGVAERSAHQWAHLWVWQGNAGDDPSEHATNQKDSLLARLKNSGGAAVMQSELDSTVANYFSALEDQLFTRSGKPKANSELARAGDDLEAAEAELAMAQEAVDKLQRAVTDFQNAGRTIRETEEELKSIRSQKEETETKLAKVMDLRHVEKLREQAAEQTTKDHENLAKADDDIRRLEKEVAAQDEKLEPRNAETKRLEESENAWKKKLQVAENALRELDRQLRSTRVRSELSKAWIELFESEANRTVVRKSAVEIEKLKEKLGQSEADLARLPDVDKGKLESLQTLVGAHAEAQAALKAMAAGIEILASNLEVKVGETPLERGVVKIIDEDTEIEVGDAATLRITPGGGTSLAEAREQVRDSQQQLQESLDQMGVHSPEEAVEFLARRQQFDTAIQTSNAELAGKDSDTIEERLAAVATRLEAARAEVERRKAMVDAFPEPEDLASARSLLVEEEQALADLEAKESAARAERDAALISYDGRAEELSLHRQSVEGALATLTESKAKLSVLEETQGEAADRNESLKKLSAARKEAEDQLAETREALKKLQPDALEADKQRFERALNEADALHRQAEQARAVARNILASDGTLDPEESLALARGKFEFSRNRHASVSSQAAAIRLLTEMFSEEQRALAQQFTQPLAEKISGYLQQLFGPEASARVTLSDGEFEELRLTRPGGTFDFASLSRGAREQLAAAVRLSMAEILAEDHDGCLPIVFDDSFVNSDPDRVQALQRMLDLAARRGLQVILLTCNPVEFAGLGARTVMIAQKASETVSG